MSESTTPSVPAGWFPDPAGSPRSRWWDGTQWTEHFQEPYSREAAMAALQAPAGAKIYNLWIWLVVFLPYVTLPFVFTIDYSAMYASGLDTTDPYATNRAQFEMMTSPGYVLSTLLGWAIYGLCVFFAFRDSRALTSQGIQRPFHWAWNFLSPVYAIGRAVVVKRRTGRGSIVLWAAIGMIVVSFIVVIAMTAMIMSAVMQQLGPISGY
jgi:hypothetical protein